MLIFGGGTYGFSAYLRGEKNYPTGIYSGIRPDLRITDDDDTDDDMMMMLLMTLYMEGGPLIGRGGPLIATELPRSTIKPVRVILWYAVISRK